MEIRICKECGFILGTRPNSKDVNGVCLACLNKERKNTINWKERQNWLTEYLEEHKNPDGQWDVLVGVSGGKDSCAIVSRLIEEHKVPHDRMLLVHVMDEFTPSKAGLYNLDNWVCDPLAKRDFCRTIGITEKEFDDVIDTFANRDLLVKDANGKWRRKDLI